MSGKPKNKKAPKVEEPLDDEAPIEEIDEQFEEEAVEEKSTPKEKKTDSAKKKSSKNGFKLSSVDPIILTSFTVFMVACLIVTGVTVYGIFVNSSSEKNAEYGDAITVDYVGSFYAWYDEEGAFVFDTTLQDVADNSDILKSYTFKSDKTFKSVDLTIGKGEYLSDFESALIGHKPGDTVRIKIDTADAYGAIPSSQKFTDVTQASKTLNKITTLELADFKTLFNYSDTLTVGTYTIKSPYGWDASVTVNGDNTVNVEYLATAGETYHPYNEGHAYYDAITIKVNSIDPNPDPLNPIPIINYDYQVNAFDDSTKMLRTAIDDVGIYIIASGDGKMTYKTSNETVGMPLYFMIKFVGYSESS